MVITRNAATQCAAASEPLELDASEAARAPEGSGARPVDYRAGTIATPLAAAAPTAIGAAPVASSPNALYVNRDRCD